MPNYKPPINDTVNIGGYVHYMKSGDKLIKLISNTNAQNKSLFDIVTITYYKVPTGKKFQIINLIDLNKDAICELAYTTVQNSETGKVILIGATALDLNNEIWLSPNIPADMYITQITSGFVAPVQVWGIESDV